MTQPDNGQNPNGDKPPAASPPPATPTAEVASTESPQPHQVRSRSRRNVVGRSPHRDDYVRLMRAGWSSDALERYAAFRYGEDIPGRTFRLYREKLEMEPARVYSPGVFDQPIDVLEQRRALIALQEERIRIDVQHERSMSKLFATTKGEIELLSRLLGEHKVDLQDLGLLPRPGDLVRLEVSETPAMAPRARTLGDLFGVDPGAEQELAKVLHMKLRGTGTESD